jgi:exodeoxyribonuclease III
VRLITWNVARRRTRLAEQAAALAERSPDVVALQEVTPTTEPLWRETLPTIGLPHVACSLEWAEPGRAPAGPRRTGVLLASAGALDAEPTTWLLPWPEVALSARVQGSAGDLLVHTIHVPQAANGVIKPQTLDALYEGLAGGRRERRVVCGDLNTPRRETIAGEVVTFAQDRYGRLRPERGETWDRAERRILCDLDALDLVDAFRDRNGYEARDVSWTWRRWKGGYRLDHAFASADLRLEACGYVHEWREAGLSDHSALELTFRL